MLIIVDEQLKRRILLSNHENSPSQIFHDFTVLENKSRQRLGSGLDILTDAFLDWWPSRAESSRISAEIMRFPAPR